MPIACTHGGRSVDRCTNAATAVIIVASGKRRPRCIWHVEWTDLRATPEEERAYFERRRRMRS